ncbi:thiol-disulfide oxidoreductase DCC family protein [Cohnella lupini]|uniref:Putative DCC family thiol-disulfide oxidoreductase YuxK n=1 Tax=Cohnella lupini TaxID=1294267 RepID=A0A3D9IVZ7_9BACL|nr:thiol-disulfide oxidoreductase DCC family protein [Cohnella lupini]RED66000.1 putative DCC family thiol-disulfide oxidoreductase YuxK [Cohnella lupini]
MSKKNKNKSPGEPILLLIDGQCNLCHGITRFVIARDPAATFRFASLQSGTGRRLLETGGLPTTEMNTVVMIDNGRYYTKSTAALRICKNLGGPWKLLYAGIVVPPAIRNRVYDFIAKRRYRWFGRQDSCLMPTEDIRRRFLPDAWGAEKDDG